MPATTLLTARIITYEPNVDDAPYIAMIEGRDLVFKAPSSFQAAQRAETFRKKEAERLRIDQEKSDKMLADHAARKQAKSEDHAA